MTRPPRARMTCNGNSGVLMCVQFGSMLSHTCLKQNELSLWESEYGDRFDLEIIEGLGT